MMKVWRSINNNRARAGFLLSVTILICLAVACNRQDGHNVRLTSASGQVANNPSAPAPASTNPTATMPTMSYADVVSKAAPAVVTIHSQMRVRQPQQ